MTFTEIHGCVHASLHAADAVGAARFTVRCEDCGHAHEVTTREWRSLLAGQRSETLMALASGDDARRSRLC